MCCNIYLNISILHLICAFYFDVKHSICDCKKNHGEFEHFHESSIRLEYKHFVIKRVHLCVNIEKIDDLTFLYSKFNTRSDPHEKHVAYVKLTHLHMTTNRIIILLNHSQIYFISKKKIWIKHFKINDSKNIPAKTVDFFHIFVMMMILIWQSKLTLVHEISCWKDFMECEFWIFSVLYLIFIRFRSLMK